MSEQEYFQRLDSIKKKIADGMLAEAEKELQWLYSYKPVRLPWFIANAELKLKKGEDIEEILRQIRPEVLYVVYNYPGMEEYLEFLDKIEDHLDSREYKHLKYLASVACGRDVTEYEKRLEDKISCYMEERGREQLAELADALYVVDEMISYLIVRMEQERQNWAGEDAFLLGKVPNSGYLRLKVLKERENTIVIMRDSQQTDMTGVFARILSQMGHKVFLVDLPVDIEVEEPLPLLQTLDITLDNITGEGKMRILTPVNLFCQGEYVGDNRDYILEFIYSEWTPNGNVIVMASGRLLDELCQRPILRKRMERLSNASYNAEIYQEQMQFGWFGDYLNYIGDLYGYNVRERMEKESKCEYSIVIPARNSSFTLRYTLQTCLNQRYQGSYEIVVSDNSVNGNDEIYCLCEDLQNPRIRYVKTPRDFLLTKSFEYAILQARGEFIIPIGSDDGLLPWALEVIDEVRRLYPEEPIIQWYRGFYCWPGFNGGQENMFVIPEGIEKGYYREHFVTREEYRKRISESSSMIYAMPNLYINSGFHRDYMWRLLKETGRLWDGWNQDAYMGIINTCINKRILNICYPLAIAGMSSSSIGSVYASDKTGKEKEEALRRIKMMEACGNMGEYIIPAKGRQLLDTANDEMVVAHAISRAVHYGIWAEEEADVVLNYKRVFAKSLEQELAIWDDRFDKWLHVAKNRVDLLGSEFHKWFMDEVYSKVTQPVQVDMESIASNKREKVYKEERRENGGITTDASKYGVKDIAEAVELYVKMAGNNL